MLDDGGVNWDSGGETQDLSGFAAIWTEVYPSGKNFYKRRRGYIVMGGEKINGRWRGGKRRRVNVEYLGRVYGYESIPRTKERIVETDNASGE